MAIAGNQILKALTMSDSCLLPFPSLCNSKTIYSCHAVPAKPIKLHLSSCSTNPSIFLPTLSLRKKTHFSFITTFVAQTSDWAAKELQQLEQDLEAEQEEPVAENGNLVEGEPSFPEGESEGEDYLFGGDGAEDGAYEEREDGDYVEPAGVDDFVEPPEDAKLFVGNLPYDVDCDALAALFDQAGTVEIAEVIYNRETERSRGFGFVTMSTVAEAEKAVEKFHQYDMGGRFLTVNKAAPRGARVERTPRDVGPSFTVYVGNLPWDVDDARLQQIFGEHGKVTSARVIYDRETNRSRGFAFVTMATETEMNDAVAALDGQSVDGRTIRVSVAENRPRR